MQRSRVAKSRAARRDEVKEVKLKMKTKKKKTKQRDDS
jgi:hypothetical protein